MTKKNNLVSIFIILVFGFLFQFKYIQEFPSNIHAWAQSDRYALSLGFVKNDLNFIKPQTFVLNRQFPNEWKEPSAEGTTAVDFPVHDFLAAIIMKITGNTSPVIFRLYILFYSFIGLYYLFKIGLLFTNNSVKSLLLLIFAATSPVFVYYQGGFLPTIPSISNTLIGIYLFFIYLKNENKKYFNLSLVFLTIAALSRSTFLISLISILSIEFYRIIKKETSLKGKIIPVGCSLIALLSYFFYNNLLRQEYGSVFLSHLMMAENYSEIKEIIQLTLSNWKYHYFSKLHYLFIIVSIAISLFYILFKKSRKGKIEHLFTLFILVQFIGFILFSFLMLKQFPNHDYYFLDTFYIPTILLLLITLIYIPDFNFGLNVFMLTSVIIVVFYWVSNVFEYQVKRRETGSWDLVGKTIENFKHSDNFLKSLHINETSKILVLSPQAPNIPFILMDRFGYAIMSSNKNDLSKALKWDFDYLVYQNDLFLNETYFNFPEIINKIEKIGDNGKISVCKLKKYPQKQTLFSFLKLKNQKTIYEKEITFEKMNSSNEWQN